MAEATAPPPGGSRGFFLRQRQRPRQARWRWRAARSVIHPAHSQGEETGREGGGRWGGSGACDAPPTGLCARVTAGPLGVRLPLSVTVGGGGKREEGQAPPLSRASRARGGARWWRGRGDTGVGAGLGWLEGGGLEGFSEWESPGRNRGGASECLERLVRGWVRGETGGVQAGAK